MGVSTLHLHFGPHVTHGTLSVLQFVTLCSLWICHQQCTLVNIL